MFFARPVNTNSFRIFLETDNVNRFDLRDLGEKSSAITVIPNNQSINQPTPRQDLTATHQKYPINSLLNMWGMLSLKQEESLATWQHSPLNVTS